MRGEKEAQAKDLVREHRPKLRPGIALQVKFADPPATRGTKTSTSRSSSRPTRRDAPGPRRWTTGSTRTDSIRPRGRWICCGWTRRRRPCCTTSNWPGPRAGAAGPRGTSPPLRHPALIVDAILAVNDGQTPRPFVSAQAEDGLGLQDGHIDRARARAAPYPARSGPRILEPGRQPNDRAPSTTSPTQRRHRGLDGANSPGANWPAFRDLLLTEGRIRKHLHPGSGGVGARSGVTPGVQVPIPNPAAPTGLPGTRRRPTPGVSGREPGTGCTQ